MGTKSRAGRSYCWTRYVHKIILAAIVFAVVFAWPVAAYAEEAGEGERLDRIRAGYYLDDNCSTGRNVGYLLNGDLVFDKILFGTDEKSKGLANNAEFRASVAAWKAAHYFTGSDNPVENMLDVQGYFEAIIFAVLKADASSRYPELVSVAGSATSVGVDVAGKMNKVLGGVVDTMKDAELLKYDSRSLTPVQLEKLKGALDGVYFNNHPSLDTASWGTSRIVAFLSAAKDVQEGVESIVSYGNLVEGATGQRELLRRMYERCPMGTDEERALKAALGAAHSAMDGRVQAYLTGSAIAVEKVVGKTATQLAYMVLDEASWACPHFKAFMIGAKLGDAVTTPAVNQVFSTDGLVEQYEKSLALRTFHDLAVEATVDAGAAYRSGGSVADAQAFLAGVDVLYNSKLESLDYTKKFYDLVYDESVYGRLFKNRSEYLTALATIENVRKDVKEMRDSLYRDFRAYFNEDDPALYAQYFNATPGPSVLQGISFPVEECVVCTGDPLPAIPAVESVPRGIATGGVTYISSDESILQVNSHNVGCAPKRAGTVTVTATCDLDPSMTASVTVRVVDGESGLARTTYVIDEEMLLTSDVFFVGDLIVEGSVDLAGHTLAVTGDLEHQGGEIAVSHGELDVGGSYMLRYPDGTASDGSQKYASSSGSLSMKWDDDVVRVGGDADFWCYYGLDDELAAGAIYVAGGLRDRGGNFCPAGTRVVLCGEGVQTVDFPYTGSRLAQLVDAGGDGVSFPGYLSIGDFAHDLTVAGNARVRVGLDLAGHTLAVTGDLEHQGGEIAVSHGELDVGGSYMLRYPDGTASDGSQKYASSSGSLSMKWDDDVVRVGGDADFWCYYGLDDELAAGAIYVAGGLRDRGGNFCPAGTRVVLCGEGVQTVDFPYTGSRLASLEFANGAKVRVAKYLGLGTLSYDLNVDGDLELAGDLNLAGHSLMVSGNLLQTSGTVTLNKGSLSVGGDYRIQSTSVNSVGETIYGSCSSRLSMLYPEDEARVGGDFWFQSSYQHSESLLKDGTLWVSGDFHDLSSNYFRPAGSHLTVLDGKGFRTVEFPSTTDRFNRLMLQQDSQFYVFSHDPCWRELVGTDYVDPRFEPKVFAVAVAPKSATLARGDRLQLQAWVFGENGFSDEVAWTVEDASGAGTAIDANGLLTVGADEPAGTLTVAATSAMNPSCRATAQVVVSDASFSVADAEVTLPRTGYVYTGSAVEPEPTVTLNGATLVRGDDYEVSYEGNVQPGTATVYVSGKGRYEGLTSATFEIGRANLTREGWVDLPGGEKGYARGGDLVRGWMDLGSSKFWFHPDGVLARGWTDVTDSTGKTFHYYFNPSSGNLARGTWMDIGGAKYYFRPSGNMATGWADIDGKKFYFDREGHMLTGWQDVAGGHYYFRPSGAMATGWATIDGASYWFRPSGNMATGWADVDDAYKRFFDRNGQMVTGWQTIDGRRYYFRSSGAMQTGKATIGGQEYEFSASGVLVSGPVGTQSESDGDESVVVTAREADVQGDDPNDVFEAKSSIRDAATESASLGEGGVVEI